MSKFESPDDAALIGESANFYQAATLEYRPTRTKLFAFSVIKNSYDMLLSSSCFNLEQCVHFQHKYVKSCSFTFYSWTISAQIPKWNHTVYNICFDRLCIYFHRENAIFGCIITDKDCDTKSIK